MANGQKKFNGDQPATQADLATWGGRLQEQINDLKKGQEELKAGQQATNGRLDGFYDYCEMRFER